MKRLRSYAKAAGGGVGLLASGGAFVVAVGAGSIPLTVLGISSSVVLCGQSVYTIFSGVKDIDLNKQIVSLDSAILALDNENTELKETLYNYKKQLNKFKKENKNLCIQIDKLKEVYKNSRALLSQMARTSDLFNVYNEGFGENVKDLKRTKSQYERILKEMRIITERLKDAKFESIDEDNDGVITRKEFIKWISKQ